MTDEEMKIRIEIDRAYIRGTMGGLAVAMFPSTFLVWLGTESAWATGVCLIAACALYVASMTTFKEEFFVPKRMRR